MPVPVSRQDCAAPLLVIEQPNAWLKHHAVGASYGRFFGHLAEACARLGLRTILEPGSWGEGARPRAPAPHEIWLTFHTINEQPNVWSLKEAYLKDWFSFDRNGYSGWSSLARNPVDHAATDITDAEYDAVVKPIAAGMLEGNVSKYSQPSRRGRAGLPASFVFLALQVEDDSTLSHGRFPQADILGSAIELAGRHRRHLVIKPHPLSRQDYPEASGETDGGDFVHWYRGSVIDALDAADAVLVCNSGVGFEALILARPVYTYGASEYAPVTNAIRTAADLEQLFATASHGFETPRVRAFLLAYLTRHCVRDTDLAGMMGFLRRAIDLWRGTIAAPRQSAADPSLPPDLHDTIRNVERHLAVQGVAPRELVAEIRRSNIARGEDLQNIMRLLQELATPTGAAP